MEGLCFVRFGRQHEQLWFGFSELRTSCFFLFFQVANYLFFYFHGDLIKCCDTDSSCSHSQRSNFHNSRSVILGSYFFSEIWILGILPKQNFRTQLRELKTEDLKVSGLIPDHGNIFSPPGTTHFREISASVAPPLATPYPFLSLHYKQDINFWVALINDEANIPSDSVK